MFLSRNKKNNIYPCKPQFYYIKVGFKGVKFIKACFRDDSLRLNKLPQTMYFLEESNYNFKYVRICDLDVPVEKIAKLFANSGDPDLMWHSLASDQGLHCLLVTLLGSPD